MIKMILATGENGELGLDGKLPWDCPEDLAYFKKCTLGDSVLMGRKTFDGIPFENGLPNRKNYVLTNSPMVEDTKDIVYLERFGNLYSTLSSHKTSKDILWLVGGKSIYENFLEFVDEIHHTTIEGDFDADVSFDTSFLEKWEHVSSEVLSEIAVVRVYRRKYGSVD